jgi:hypothetical protein
MLPNFNQNCNISTNVSKTLQYQIGFGILVLSLPTEELSPQRVFSLMKSWTKKTNDECKEVMIYSPASTAISVSDKLPFGQQCYLCKSKVIYLWRVWLSASSWVQISQGYRLQKTCVWLITYVFPVSSNPLAHRQNGNDMLNSLECMEICMKLDQANENGAVQLHFDALNGHKHQVYTKNQISPWR